MKINFVMLIVRLTIGISLLLPPVVVGDQSDGRLEELFSILQSSHDGVEQQEAELAIWTIWYDSGREDIDRIMERGGSAVQADDLRQAEALYSQVIEMAPKFSEGWNRRATVRFYQRDYEGSLDDIEITLRLEPRHFGATWGLGMILGFQRDFSGAIAAFERLLEIKPNARDARFRIELLKQEIAKNSV